MSGTGAGSVGASRQRLDWLTIEPTDRLRLLRDRRRLVALIGAWHHGDALIAFDPDRDLTLDDDAFAVGDQPPARADDTFGGCWFGVWGYRLGRLLEVTGPEPHRPQPHPDHVVGHCRHVLRRTCGVWWAESLDDAGTLATWVGCLARGGRWDRRGLGDPGMSTCP